VVFMMSELLIPEEPDNLGKVTVFFRTDFPHGKATKTAAAQGAIFRPRAVSAPVRAKMFPGSACRTALQQPGI